MTLKAVYACDGCGRMEATDSEAAHGWVQVFRPGQVTTSDRHFCGFRCLEDFARTEQDRVARERTVDERADEPGATQPGTKPLKRVGVFRASHGKHGNADEAHDAEVIHKGSLPAEERAE